MIKRKINNLTYDLIARGESNIQKLSLREIRIEQNSDMRLNRGQNEKSANTSSINSKGSRGQERMKYRMMKIWGQLPLSIHASEPIAEFNLRGGMEIGNLITIREESGLDRVIKQLLFIGWPRKSPLQAVITVTGESSEEGKGQSLGRLVKEKKDKVEIEYQVGYGETEELTGSYVVVNDWPMGEVIERVWSSGLTIEDLDLEIIMGELREMKVMIGGMRVSIKVEIEGKSEGAGQMSEFIRTYMKLPERG
jgi:hypothetical protein